MFVRTRLVVEGLIDGNELGLAHTEQVLRHVAEHRQEHDLDGFSWHHVGLQFEKELQGVCGGIVANIVDCHLVIIADLEDLPDLVLRTDREHKQRGEYLGRYHKVVDLVWDSIDIGEVDGESAIEGTDRPIVFPASEVLLNLASICTAVIKNV